MLFSRAMSRRRLLSLVGASAALTLEPMSAHAIVPAVTLLNAPLELAGGWGGSEPGDVTQVIGRMRRASLSGVALISERQPEKLRIEDHSSGPPSIWLHAGEAKTAWIIVIVGARDWCNLAYQFGHELGHVLCNSWEQSAKPRPPCQWIEEALAEAFSLRGLALLAGEWARTPPFKDDADYADAIHAYRKKILGDYQTAAQRQGGEAGLGAWFARNRNLAEGNGGLEAASGAVATMLGLLEGDTTMVSDMGALNRWPGRSGVALPEYLELWQQSCAKLQAPGRLPAQLGKLLADTDVGPQPLPR